MTPIKQLLIILCCALLTACAVSGRLQRQQAAAALLHIARAEREQQAAASDLRPKGDSARYMLVRTESVDSEQVLTVDIPQITVQARSRTLPERLGRVRIDFSIDLPRSLSGTLRSVVVVPHLHKHGGTQPLQPINVRGTLFSRVQQRDYWQYDRFVQVFRPDAARAERAFSRMVKYPRTEDVRLDSVVQHPGRLRYYYRQEVPTNETSKTMHITLQGWVEALDGSYYPLPPSDTLTYHVSSLLSLMDTTTRYKIRVIEKFATLEERRSVQYRVGSSSLIDTLGRNREELGSLIALMTRLQKQHEFFIDSLVLTASASPEGTYAHNLILARSRAYALKAYLARKGNLAHGIPIRVRWKAEDWDELLRRIDKHPAIAHREQIVRLIDVERDPDMRERRLAERHPDDYRYIRQVIYPQLRAVSIRCHLRRAGMVKDTIHTREVDTAYMRGLDLLQRREYARSIEILQEYRDRNTVIALLSLGRDEQALDMLEALPTTAITEYLRAIASVRTGRTERGRRHFLRACEMDSRMEYRGNLDPEITQLKSKK